MKNKFIPVLTQYFNNSAGVPGIPDPERIFYDTFTDTNFTLLSAHTPDLDTAGNGWDDNNTIFQVSNNKLEIITGPPTFPAATTFVDVESSNVQILVTALEKFTPAWDVYPFGTGIGFRGKFNTDQYYLLVLNGDYNQWVFGIYDEGSVDYVGSPTTVAVVGSGPFNVRIDVFGTQCKIYIDDDLKFDETLSQISGTKHGCHSVDYEPCCTAIDIYELYGMPES